MERAGRDTRGSSPTPPKKDSLKKKKTKEDLEVKPPLPPGRVARDVLEYMGLITDEKRKGILRDTEKPFLDGRGKRVAWAPSRSLIRYKEIPSRQILDIQGALLQRRPVTLGQFRGYAEYYRKENPLGRERMQMGNSGATGDGCKRWSTMFKEISALCTGNSGNSCDATTSSHT